MAEVDWRGSYDSLISTFRRGDCGVLSGGAALALWRAATDAGFRAWCYDFGFPESLTHMVTVIELDGRLRVHDPFLNLGYREDFYEILEGLRADRLPDIRCETRDRKIYVMDPSCESQLTADWLTAHADRELDRVGSLRRFEVLWDRDALLATLARPEAVYRDLETRGYPADLSYLMLHPIGVFDGGAHHQNPETMPLIGGRDLRSPVAGLRAAMQQLTQALAVERDQLAEKSAISGRLESELAEARSQLLAASGEAEQLSAQSVQLRAALDDGSRQWVAERQALSQGNSALEERRAVLEAELAEATARHAAATEEARRLADQVVQLRSARDEFEQAAAASAADWAQERRQLQEGTRTLDEDNRKLQAAVAGIRAYLAAVRGETGELRATIDRRTAKWEEERQRLREAAQALEGDVLRLREELAQTSAQLVDAQAEGAELRDDLDRRSAEWDAERRSFQTSLAAIKEDAQTAFAEWARAQLNAEQAATQAIWSNLQVAELVEKEAAAQLRAEKATAQATWSNLQVAELVEKEVAVASELTRRRDEIVTLGMQVEALQLAELGRHQLEEAINGFVFGVNKLLGVDFLPVNDLPVVLTQLRKHIREREREMDVVEAERNRLDEALRAQVGRGAQSERPGTFLRRLFAKRADPRTRLIPIRG